ncbi:MAG: hypothetical protein Q9207_000941 [Kuettlingeria erythrocarpa]
MWTVVNGKDPLIYYKRKIFTAECAAYKGSFAVDFVVPPHTETDVTLPPRTTNFDNDELRQLGSDDDKPMLVTLHGLTGGSQEAYLRHLLFTLYKEGWDACVLNARGCAQSKLTSSVLFNARATWDIRQLMKWLRERFPHRPLFAIGYSLGACILVNYGTSEDMVWLGGLLQIDGSGYEGALRAVRRVQRVYAFGLLNDSSHIEQITKNPRIDVNKVRRAKYLHEFDR